MSNTVFCPECGAKNDGGAHFCAKCGHDLKEKISGGSSKSEQTRTIAISPKSARTALLLALFLGPIGAHRFYVGKIGTGILMLLTGGGLGIWALIDLVVIASCEFKDAEGKLLEFKRGKPEDTQRVLKIVGLVFAAIIVYITMLIFLVSFLTSGLVKTINSQLDAIRQGDIVKAYSYTSIEFQKTISLEDFKKIVQQLPTLKDNKSSSFSHREIVNNQGEVKGTLTAKDGSTSFAEYRLIYENDEWKILGIHVSPSNKLIQQNNESTANDPVSLPNTFKNSNHQYIVKYPDDWVIEQPDRATLAFGKNGQNTNGYVATINIQSLLTRKSGGHYRTVDQALDDMKTQASRGLANYKLLDQGEMELPKNPARFKGKYILISYRNQGTDYKQMIIMIERDDGKLFYSWGYTAQAEVFDQYLPYTKAMFESWEIY